MLWWCIVPTAAVILLDIILVWESRIPEKKNPEKMSGVHVHPKNRFHH